MRDEDEHEDVRQTCAFPGNMSAFWRFEQALQTWHSAHLRLAFWFASPQWCSCDAGNASFGRSLSQTSHRCLRFFTSHVRQTRSFPGNMSAL